MTDKFVINIGRQIGSGGLEIGQRVAQRLGISIYDKELLREVAMQSGLCDDLFERVDEKEPTTLFSSVVYYLRSPFVDRTSDNILSGDSLFKIQSDVIRDIATRESALFVGRCADYVLRDHSRAINIFLSANMPDRIERVMRYSSVDSAQAEKIIEKIDAQRASYYNYYSSKKWGEASTYHLCVNSSMLGVEGSMELIVDFVRRSLNLQ